MKTGFGLNLIACILVIVMFQSLWAVPHYNHFAVGVIGIIVFVAFYWNLIFFGMRMK